MKGAEMPVYVQRKPWKQFKCQLLSMHLRVDPWTNQISDSVKDEMLKMAEVSVRLVSNGM